MPGHPLCSESNQCPAHTIGHGWIVWQKTPACSENNQCWDYAWPHAKYKGCQIHLCSSTWVSRSQTRAYYFTQISWSQADFFSTSVSWGKIQGKTTASPVHRTRTRQEAVLPVKPVKVKCPEPWTLNLLSNLHSPSSRRCVPCAASAWGLCMWSCLTLNAPKILSPSYNSHLRSVWISPLSPSHQRVFTALLLNTEKVCMSCSAFWLGLWMFFFYLVPTLGHRLSFPVWIWWFSFSTAKIKAHFWLRQHVSTCLHLGPKLCNWLLVFCAFFNCSILRNL